MIINFGKYSLQTKIKDGKQTIYDIVRKKWIIITPEEQVRQIWLHYLVHDLHISPSRIAVEKGLKVNNRIKRFDICIYDEKLNPEILIECKAPNLKLITPNFEQLSIYNIELNARKFIITNGLEHVGYEIINDKVQILENIL
jgi:hypothetical protein